MKVHGCYIWDDVTIEDGCVLRNAIVCDGVTVHANTTVQERTILSWNVSPCYGGVSVFVDFLLHLMASFESAYVSKKRRLFLKLSALLCLICWR